MRLYIFIHNWSQILDHTGDWFPWQLTAPARFKNAVLYIHVYLLWGIRTRRCDWLLSVILHCCVVFAACCATTSPLKGYECTGPGAVLLVQYCPLWTQAHQGADQLPSYQTWHVMVGRVSWQARIRMSAVVLTFCSLSPDADSFKLIWGNHKWCPKPSWGTGRLGSFLCFNLLFCFSCRGVQTQSSRATVHPGFLTNRVENSFSWVPTAPCVNPSLQRVTTDTTDVKPCLALWPSMV